MAGICVRVTILFLLFVGCFLLLFVAFCVGPAFFVVCWLFFGSVGASSELRPILLLLLFIYYFFLLLVVIFIVFVFFGCLFVVVFGSVGASLELRQRFVWLFIGCFWLVLFFFIDLTSLCCLFIVFLAAPELRRSFV